MIAATGKPKSGWEEYKLGELCCNISYGYTESASSEPIGPKFLRITDIVPGRVNWATVPYCKISNSNQAKYKLQEGDIVIARTGATTGHTYTIKPDDLKYDSVFASYLIRYRIDTQKADPFYIGHLLTGVAWKGFVGGVAGGSAQPGANAKQFADFDILLPPLPEQHAIAAVLSSLDDKIDLLHRQNKTLESLASALWRKMFIEEAGVDWKNGNLGDIAEINPLRSLKKGQAATYLDMSNMPTSGAFPLDWVPRCYTSGMKFKNGDTIVARITPCLENGKTAYINFLNENEVAWGSTEYVVLSPKTAYCSEWFYFLARHNDFREFMIQNMTGTSGRQRVSGESIAQYDMLTPPVKITQDFGLFAVPAMEHIKHNSLQIRTLSKTRDALLPKLMSGEVLVKS
ncbi:MAG TPA: restriction endonuclease subunit S [Elusimicrobia bacterium]|nr:restriction endonuclease subunit S [Elusimicrobiota bacterium]